MGNLTTAQLTAIAAGAPVRQVFTIMAPAASGSSTFGSRVIDGGAQAGDSARRVTKAGSRKHSVWNPHPVAKATATAARHLFEADNSDGVFFPGHAYSWWNNATYQATPEECHFQHSLFIKEADGSWSEVTSIRFTGRVIAVAFSDTASPGPVASGSIATITVEQLGAWGSLRRVWTEDDGTHTQVTDGTSGALEF